MVYDRRDTDAPVTIKVVLHQNLDACEDDGRALEVFVSSPFGLLPTCSLSILPFATFATVNLARPHRPRAARSGMMPTNGVTTAE
jgi:hypothetical protein